MIRSVAVDMGASSGRVIGGGFDGSRLTIEEVHRFKNAPVTVHGRMFWDVYQLFAEMKFGITSAAKRYGDIASIGIDTWAVDYGLLDKDGMLMNLPRHYRDVRTEGMIDRVEQKVTHHELFSRTGIQFMRINTIFQLDAELEQNPDRLHRATDLLLIPDLFNYFLTGRKFTEFTNATTTQLLNVQTGTWDTNLLNQLGLPTSIFTQIVQPGTKLSYLQDADLLQSKELESTSVVHVASHDTASAVLAVPARDDLHAYISSGTWSLFGTVVQSPIVDAQTEALNFTNEGGFHNYRLLKNIMGLWVLQQTQDFFAYSGRSYSIEEIMQHAATSNPFQFFFDVDDERLIHPGQIPEIIGGLCEATGQSRPANDGILVRGILENLAFKYRFTLEQLESILGRRIETIHIVGGGVQNELLCQLTANVLNRPVVAGPVEASAIGNMLMQMTALGEVVGDSQRRELLARSIKTITYEPEDVIRSDEAYGTYLETLTRHDGSMNLYKENVK